MLKNRSSSWAAAPDCRHLMLEKIAGPALAKAAFLIFMEK